MPIRVLAPGVVARIAAGEVVERPASVVKELVENSLDAAASQVLVEMTDGGVGLVRVSDNGVGIPPDELELAFQRYATSKITTLEDLESATTLGFRGEALASIAAVACVELLTCARGESAGSYLSLKEGVAAERGRRARGPGTTVTVRELFRSVPARLKFLKSPATESGHIAGVVSQYAMAYPEVRFTMVLDGRTVLSTPGSGRLLDAVVQVYGLEVAGQMLEIGGGEWEAGPPGREHVRVGGMVGAPAISRASRNYLSFFVNRRWISSRQLAWAVEEAYQGLLMTGKHPVTVINVTLPPSEVDVNVHPAKSEVKFQDERAVFGAVQKAVRATLLRQAPVPRIEEVATAYRGAAMPSQKVFHLPTTATSPGPIPDVAPVPTLALPALRVLGQLGGNYIVAEGPDSLYLIDQHAAHERVLFERVSRSLSEGQIEVQGLLEPATIELTPGQDEVLKGSLDRLAGYGFALESFGARTYLVRTVPAPLHGKDWRAALRELLDAGAGTADGWRTRAAESIACHAAVRAGQVLGAEEMRELVRLLEKAAVPNTCPHGRPTLVRLTLEQVRREFGRA